VCSTEKREADVTRILSGIKPTGEVHLGNYIGAIRHWARAQGHDEVFILVVNLHALTVPQTPETLRAKTMELTAVLIAAGIDPVRSTLFVQSQVPEHAELGWTLGCFSSFGELRRMTQFKEKSQQGREAGASVGLFTYPVLQAADILLYQAERVPVGEDQQQHLELARNIAERFNRRFGDTFVVPEAAIPPIGARIMDLRDPASKMSKSEESPMGTIRVIDSPDDLRAKVMSAVTDSGRTVAYHPAEKPAISNLLTILSVALERSIEELESAYGGHGYASFKADVAEALIEFLRPVRTRYLELIEDRQELERLLTLGAERARVVAQKTLAEVYERVGLFSPVCGQQGDG
jgi:tryptophanyl-tRNA synthetase